MAPPPAPHTALSSVLPPCSHIWSIWSTCPWHVPPEPPGLSSRSSCEHLLTRQPFPERKRGATLSTAPSLSSPDHIYLHVLPTPQQKDGNLPTGQPANGPVLLHFLLTFFINLSTVRLIWLVSTVIVPIAKKSSVYAPPWEGEMGLPTGWGRKGWGGSQGLRPTMTQILGCNFKALFALVLMYWGWVVVEFTV